MAQPAIVILALASSLIGITPGRASVTGSTPSEGTPRAALRSQSTQFPLPATSTSPLQEVAPRISPRPENLDYFLSRSCYGLFAREPEPDFAHERPEDLAAIYVAAGCKFIRWTDFTWRVTNDDSVLYGWQGWTPRYFELVRRFIAAVHAADPEVVVEIGLAEYICQHTMDRTTYDFSSFPGFEEYGAGTFDFYAMLRPGSDTYWRNPQCQGLDGIPDLSGQEGRKLYLWFALNYLRAGAEAFFLAETFITAPSAADTLAVAELLRGAGSSFGRRGAALVGGEAFLHSGYELLIDRSDPSAPRPIVDYMKGIAEIDVVRSAGTPTTPAQATAIGDVAYDCVDNQRMLWESRLGQRLQPGDACVVDFPLLRWGSSLMPDGFPDPRYGTVGPWGLGYQFLVNNPFRIPVVFEADGAGQATPLDDPSKIRTGINPQIAFLASRGSGRRDRAIRSMVWAARHLTTRDGIPTYLPAPVKMDGTNPLMPWGPYYELLTYCPGGNSPGPRIDYQTRPEMCNDFAPVQAVLDFEPADLALVALTRQGSFVVQGGGFETNRCPLPAGTFRDLEILPDQNGYYLLDDLGRVSACGTAVPWSGWSGNALRLALDEDGRIHALIREGTACAVRRGDGSAVGAGFACDAPVDLAIGAGTDPPLIVVLDESGLVWWWSGTAWLESKAFVYLELDPGDSWQAIVLAGGQFYAASRMGRVARVAALSGAEPELVSAARWAQPIATDLVSTTHQGELLLFLLESFGGMHPVPRTLDGQSVGAFPSFYPYGYYALPGHVYVDLSVVRRP